MEIKITINDRLVRGVKRICNRRVMPFVLAVILSGVSVSLAAEQIDIPFDFKSGEVISSSQMNANFALLEDKVNELDGQVETLSGPDGVVWGSAELNPDCWYMGGNVGIGTSTPASLLHLYSNGGAVGIEVESGDVSNDPCITLDISNDNAVKLWRNGGTNSLNFNTGGSTSMTIKESGEVGLGTSTPGELLHVWGGNLFIQGGKLIIDESSGWPFEIESIDEKLYITQYSSVGEVHLENTYNTAMDLYVERDVYAASYKTPSDARLKESIEPIEGAHDRLMAIDGVSFRFKGSDNVRLGLLAQNVRESAPEAVSVCDKSTGYLGVDYQALIPVLIEAVKELEAQNELLLERVAALEAR